MIQILHNSKSDNYIKLKEKFTGNYFPWYFNNNVAREEFNTEDNVFYFGHTLYTRPEVSGYSQPASENFQLAFSTMQEILTENIVSILQGCNNLFTSNSHQPQSPKITQIKQ